MTRLSADQIAERAIDLGLVSDAQISELRASFGGRDPSPEEFMQALVSRGWMTNFQLDRIVKGERTGFVYGDYKVQYLVGTGTFARVFRAAHKETGEVFALKVLRNKFSDVPAQYMLFLREGELGCTLRHANIVPIYEVHSYRTTHFLVMEFVEGRNLREFVKIRKQLDPAEATRLMIDIMSGLAYAFQRAVTHKDLKMSNVLVSSKGQAKLVDFGLATMDDALADDAIVEMPNTRTVDYAALERATGVRKDDPRSDVYFAGCIYYNMLVGKPPLLETPDRIQRMNRQRFMDIVPIQKAAPQLPPHIATVVNKAMSFDPEHRYQTPREFLADLHRANARLIDSQSGEHSLGSLAGDAPDQRSVMVVESNGRMQDILRDGLKKAGYRVMMTADPARACDRCRDDRPPDCLLFNAQEIGEAALRAFNSLADDPLTQDTRALLLLDEHQQPWKARASVSEHRRVLSMPITMKQLRAALDEIFPAAAT